MIHDFDLPTWRASGARCLDAVVDVDVAATRMRVTRIHVHDTVR